MRLGELSLDVFGAQMLVKWWAEYPEDLLEQRVVRPLQDYLTSELMVTKKLTVSVMNVIKVLAKVEEANQLGRKLPPDAFYNELIRHGPCLNPINQPQCHCSGSMRHAKAFVALQLSLLTEESFRRHCDVLVFEEVRKAGSTATF